MEVLYRKRGEMMAEEKKPIGADNGSKPNNADRNINSQPVLNQRPVRTHGQAANVGARMNIKEQTPSMRRSAKEAKRINPEAPEIQRSAKRAQGYKIKKKKKILTPEVIFCAVVFVIIFALMSGMIALSFYLNLTHTEQKDYGDLKITMGLSNKVNEIESQSIRQEKYIRGGVMYLDMTEIASCFEFVVTGEKSERRYITDVKNGEYVRFYTGSSVAEINGTMIRLDSSVIKDGESVFVPVSFFDDYVNGMKVDFDEDEAMISVLRLTEFDEKDRIVEAKISFKLKKSGECAHIDENKLTEEEKNLTLFSGLES